MLKYDSVHRILKEEVEVNNDIIRVAGREIRVLKIKDPADLPWKELGVEVVIEATGLFRDRDSASKHLLAGARKVVISAPAKGEDITIVMGVNEKIIWIRTPYYFKCLLYHKLLAPVIKVLRDTFGVEKG